MDIKNQPAAENTYSVSPFVFNRSPFNRNPLVMRDIQGKVRQMPNIRIYWQIFWRIHEWLQNWYVVVFYVNVKHTLIYAIRRKKKQIFAAFVDVVGVDSMLT